MVVGVMRMTLHQGEAGSLKTKRKVLRSVLDRVRAKFNVSAAEVGSQDLWQRLELGFCVCGNQHGFVETQLREIERFVDHMAVAIITDVRVEVLQMGEMAWAPDGPSDWPA